MSLMNNNNDGLTIAYLLQKLKDELKAALSSAVETINTALDGKVPITRKVNGHALSSDVTVTKDDVGLGNVENKDSATIRSEITSTNVTDALGYTPVNKSGDTMTGTLTLSSGNLNVQNGSIYAGFSSRAFEADIEVQALAGRLFLYSQGSSTGNRGIYGVNAEGTAGSVLSVNQNNAVTLNGKAINVTGTVAIANGGTGQTGVSSTTTVSQIATAASGYTIQSARYYQWGKLAMVNLTIKNTNAMAAGSSFTIATMVSGKRPPMRSPGAANWANIDNVFIDQSGAVMCTTVTQVPAGATIAYYSTYILP